MDEDEGAGRLRRFVPVRLRPSEPRHKPGWRQRLAQVAAGAAVLICLVGAWGVVRNPFGESHVTPGGLVGVSGTGSAAEGQATSEKSASQPQRNVPAHFALTTITSATHEALFGLGRLPCGQEQCPALVKSGNGGKTWRLVHTFTHTDTSAQNGEAEPNVQPPGALSGVTFVNARVGYVFGGDLWMTKDGGASFTHISHPRSSVLDVSAGDGNVTVLTAEGCVQGSCTGHLDLTRMTPGSTSALPQPLAGVTPSAPVYSAALTGPAKSPLVFTQGAPSSTGDSPGSWQLSGNSLTPVAVRALCHGNSVVAETATAQSIVGACDATPAASTTSYSVVGSLDGGKSWLARGTGNLALPTEGRLSIATNDGTHLVATTGGPRLAADGTNRADARAALLVSTDGGRTWHNPKQPPAAGTGGYDAIAATGGHTLVALPRSGAVFWRSTDDGQTWHKATVSSSSD